MLLYKPDKNALEWKALAAACDARGPTRSRCSPPAARSRRRTTITTIASWRRLPAGPSRFPTGALAAAARSAARGRSRVLHRRCDDHRDRRRVLRARACQRQHRDRHPHRGARARDRARLRRSMRSRAARLSTVYMPGRKITMLPEAAVARVHAHGGRGRARAVAVRRSRRPTARRCAHERA